MPLPTPRRVHPQGSDFARARPGPTRQSSYDLFKSPSLNSQINCNMSASPGTSSIRLKAFGAFGAVFGPIGYELNLLYIASLVVLALSAATPLSVDRWLQARRRPPQASHALSDS